MRSASSRRILRTLPLIAYREISTSILRKHRRGVFAPNARSRRDHDPAQALDACNSRLPDPGAAKTRILRTSSPD